MANQHTKKKATAKKVAGATTARSRAARPAVKRSPVSRVDAALADVLANPDGFRIITKDALDALVHNAVNSLASSGPELKGEPKQQNLSAKAAQAVEQKGGIFPMLEKHAALNNSTTALLDRIKICLERLANKQDEKENGKDEVIQFTFTGEIVSDFDTNLKHSANNVEYLNELVDKLEKWF